MTTILVIEDETILREETSEWLTLEGYTTLYAEDGVAGVETAFRQQPDLIVCDIMMPRLDGYGVLLEIQANPATAGTPFIFITARVAHEDIRKGMGLGADDYITKPFTRLELLQAIQARLAKKAAQELEFQSEIDHLQRSLAHEHEQRLLKAKLVAMFSHDFRNPLTSILMSTSFLREQVNQIPTERQLAHLKRIEASIRQLVQMLDDVLLVAQLEIGKLDIKPEPVQVDDFLAQVVEDFQAIHGNKYPILFKSHVIAPMMVDTRMLRQIAGNLISNAIKYSAQGKAVQVIVDYDAGQCRLVVQDQGIGIPDADQARLFDTFQRGSNVDHVPGTGLGLAIVKQAVDLCGGSIDLKSKVGVGTTVTVLLPAPPEEVVAPAGPYYQALTVPAAETVV